MACRLCCVYWKIGFQATYIASYRARQIQLKEDIRVKKMKETFKMLLVQGSRKIAEVISNSGDECAL